eukprot:jgi/Botrbrau1/22676/Bobra.0132s0020.1
MVGCLTLTLVLGTLWWQSAPSAPQQVVLKGAANPFTKEYFERIYDNKIWGDFGGGSGLGSTVEYTCNIRGILRTVVSTYNIKSMIDLPCGAMVWMPLALEMLNEDQPGFRYLGVDVAANVVTRLKKELTRYPECPDDATWEFGVLDMATQPIPQGYELLFSRDALQHLSMNLVIDALENISKSQAKYLLVGSYVNSPGNFDVSMTPGGGDMFPIDLRLPPFKLTKYLHYYNEHTPDGKGMLLYEIKTLRKTDWNRVRSEAGV